MKMDNKLIGGVLLVAGTTIGAGMLALPVSTGLAGFVPSVVLFTAYWIFMTYTALLLLEVNLWMDKDANLISMAQKTLGRSGEAVSWFVYLFLLYSLTTAYLAGSGPIVIDCINSLTGITLPLWSGALPLLAIFGYFVYRGTRSVDFINRLLMIGLVVTFFGMIIYLSPHVDTQLLQHSHWRDLLIGVSVIATSFGFHIIIPSLTTYMNRNISMLVKTILIGSTIPFIVYIIWEFLSLGIIPLEGPNGIAQGYITGANGVHLLSEKLGSGLISTISRFFAFFAIVTSFLGVSLSLSDFLADGFRIKKNTHTGHIWIMLLTFGPPLLFTLIDPRAFLSALEYAGAFGVVILLGFLPALMVWWGRYHKHYVSTFRVPGGKLALALVMIASTLVVGIEILNKMGLLIP